MNLRHLLAASASVRGPHLVTHRKDGIECKIQRTEEHFSLPRVGVMSAKRQASVGLKSNNSYSTYHHVFSGREACSLRRAASTDILYQNLRRLVGKLMPTGERHQSGSGYNLSGSTWASRHRTYHSHFHRKPHLV